MGHLAERQPGGEARDFQQSRPVQNLSKNFAEFFHSDRLGCREIKHTLELLVFQQEFYSGDLIVDMYPGKPLPAAAEVPTEKKPERFDEPGKSSAVPA